MIAPPRRSDAADFLVALPRATAQGLWLEAAQIRQEWLQVGLDTQPADRPTAERNLTAIYARLGRAAPRFEWVDSPAEALPLLGGRPTLDELYRWIRDPVPRGTPPLASDLAVLVSRLRAGLGAGVVHPDPESNPQRRKKNEPWPELPPPEALRAGQPLGLVLHRGVREALHRSLADGVRRPVRAALAPGRTMPVCWYGQQEASWIAYYDALRRIGLARYGPGDSAQLGEWAALARSCGWWWPGPEVCVVAERPLELLTEPVPRAWSGEVRLRPGGIRYRDGWAPALS